MPAAPRDPQNKGTKVAYKILGKPQNMIVQDTAKQRKVKRRLNYEDTSLVR